MFATDEGSELIPSFVYILPEGLLLGIELTLVDSDRSIIVCVPLYSFTYTCGTPVVDDTLSNLLFSVLLISEIFVSVLSTLFLRPVISVVLFSSVSLIFFIVLFISVILLFKESILSNILVLNSSNSWSVTKSLWSTVITMGVIGLPSYVLPVIVNTIFPLSSVTATLIVFISVITPKKLFIY